ncbi:terminase [Parasutterella excrementihominis]|uniref:terminase n=1 Tax=Parasutterella excrementihominis TaxID=487175 RepID=UPI002431C43B|nr:terminase [Parasutterella excrementihominis]
MSKKIEDIFNEELARCYADPLRFVLWAFPWGETPETSVVRLKEPWSKKYPNFTYGPDAWACQLLDDIGKDVRARGFDGAHAVEPLRYAVASGHGIGKSAFTAWLVCWILATRPGCKGVVTANTASQLETKTWAEIRKWLKRSLIADMFDVKMTSIEALESPESWRVDALTCKEENAESFAGLHAASSTAFYIFDEASAIPEAVYEVAEGGLTDGEPMMFLFGNPTRSSGSFHACFNNYKKKQYWNIRNIDSRTVEITNKEQIKKWADEYGEDSDFFRVRVRGVFPSVSSRQFIPTDTAQSAALLSLEHNTATAAIIGVDVARFGDDDSVIYTRIGKGYLPIKRFHGLSTTDLVAKVKVHFESVKKLGFPADRIYIFVDEGGVGGGPKDMLRDDGYPVRGVQFGEKADDPQTYSRKREEMWGRMKQWLSDGGTIPNDRDLVEDLIAPEYDILPGGQVKLETKKDMKKRGLRSPDAADALALTFAFKIEEYISIGELRIRNQTQSRRSFDPFACLRGGTAQ